MLNRVKRINTAAFFWEKDKCLLKVNIRITQIMILIKRVKLCSEIESLVTGWDKVYKLYIKLLLLNRMNRRLKRKNVQLF